MGEKSVKGGKRKGARPTLLITPGGGVSGTKKKKGDRVETVPVVFAIFFAHSATFRKETTDQVELVPTDLGAHRLQGRRVEAVLTCR